MHKMESCFYASLKPNDPTSSADMLNTNQCNDKKKETLQKIGKS